MPDISRVMCLLCVVAGLLAGCDAPQPEPDPPAPTTASVEQACCPADDLPGAADPALADPPPAPLPAPTASPTPPQTPQPAATRPPAPWVELAPGIKQRYLFAPIPDTTEFSTIYALRLNPDLIDFEVYFDREQPRSMEEWQAFTGSPIVFNGGFFSSDNMPVGRLVVDGALFGFPLSRVYGPESVSIPGIFAVVDDEVAIYAAGRSTYSPRGMRFDQAIESYPMLLLPGQIPAFPEDTGVRTRRTVIGIDQQGLVIVLLIDQPIFSLYELALWLSTSDLALDTALNLDGGRSSGLAVSLPGERTIIPAYVPLPIVMLAYPDREE